MTLSRSDLTRPILVALAFNLAGEFLIFALWGLYLFPAGSLWLKAGWTATCGVAMGATIGSLVNLLVTGRMNGAAAAFASGAICCGVTAFCTLLCYWIDLATGSHFGAHEAPTLFIAGGLIPALATSIVYPWLLYSAAGVRLLARAGL